MWAEHKWHFTACFYLTLGNKTRLPLTTWTFNTTKWSFLQYNSEAASILYEAASTSQKANSWQGRHSSSNKRKMCTSISFAVLPLDKQRKVKKSKEAAKKVDRFCVISLERMINNVDVAIKEMPRKINTTRVGVVGQHHGWYVSITGDVIV